jgi:acetoin utilization deacetylase AcuC-like enzyme
MDKFWRAEAMIRRSAPANVQFETAQPASMAQLLRVHHPDYLESIRAASLGRVPAIKLGLPASAALLTRSRLETGGTVSAMWAARAEGLACNLAGGTHHAFPDRGLGYCVLNDVAIAIRDLHVLDPAARILVIDTDAHQGNGTHAIFADDPRVCTYSIHVGRNYPAVKSPGTCDVELERYADGATWLARLRSTLPEIVDLAAADLVFWIAGADLHRDDRFGQLSLTDADFEARDHFIMDLLRQRGLPAVILYGGGYNRDREHTARLHAETVLRAADY